MVVFKVDPIVFYPLQPFGKVKEIAIKNKTGECITVDVYNVRKSNIDDTPCLVIDILEIHSLSEKAKTEEL